MKGHWRHWASLASSYLLGSGCSCFYLSSCCSSSLHFYCHLLCPEQEWRGMISDNLINKLICRLIRTVLIDKHPYINTLIGSAVLLPFPLLFLLLQLFDALLQNIRPKVTLKVRQLLGTGQTVLCRLLEDIL